MTEQTKGQVMTEAAPGDLGRRLAARRTQLALTRRRTAARAGVATGYLRYLEEHPGAVPRTGVLIRLAQALETTVTELTDGAVDVPSGSGRTVCEHRFAQLSACECQALLGSHGVGRLAVTTSAGPQVMPVDYSIVDGAIVFRTTADAIPAPADGRRVTFEVDRVDEASGQRRSVLVRGVAWAVRDPREQRWYAEKEHSTAGAGGARELWVRIDPGIVTGRRVTM